MDRCHSRGVDNSGTTRAFYWPGRLQRHRRRAPALELLQAAARRRLAAGQGELDLGLEVTEPADAGCWQQLPLPITAMRMGYLLDALEVAYRALGLADAAAGDEVFAQLVAAAFQSHPDDCETGHAKDCTRLAGELAAWQAERDAWEQDEQ